MSNDIQPAGTSTRLGAADFGTRFSAFMIDALLLFAVQWVIVIVLSRQLQSVGMTSVEPCRDDALRMCEGPSSGLWVLLLAILLITTVGYHAYFEGAFGATPAKRWLGLEVIGTDGQRRIGMGRGVTRAVVRQAFWLSLFFILEASPLSVSLPPIIFIAIPALLAAGLAWGAVAADGRSLHDMAANTLVVRADSRPITGFPIVPTADAEDLS